ncbi:bifunctional D-glycero-beta-D-manno-heptose-7-phosphate kinase/D-glycero-beta-D-manno-heptose 1-phosphate adenylyltransferase HldE [Endozoicomonas sp. GU-1]|uniref:bifunctional D-glycero-beta-D-manno-heptose-7-phosphate kinase/D-glycero-beta-D-manno-heptose 1-phosphate adenylyltransferase HldE n=1 Tax=Endozoicomonas sp. GU-1 TaxID=3009078 RepID=UPI0022B4CE22|nr:bifunctional D-glycero-beta-D-manno-heptose-7-phosphate kinase/D-glycero-beta-D-manno-heptose 1-phosphate adenylyltransferase HldE [Endozoicomonas sp. GU-1]WBA82873.1 bifunctional D-glycero-beta-D-manno-heptose-7-phosphate kinase/D-glycero-beta-D-manno-heptose 1-phosphate adenylyltransferase HldE [Endozoicomonas sp. GU-1]WBA85801.1 bifunctional D-glycero-beta-D-manno-heptose-7-phosphate kinase/D-glycero-beta-D-manno-heptose 1-phosphate adenylyltransferase HldE [Endozoicomonas sp. GU-1]
MKLTIPRFDLAKVLVIGDIMLDRYWHGATSRISPEAPVPVVKVGQIEDRPGGAGNVALNIATLGAPAWVIAATGNDEAADVLQTRLEAAGIYCSFARIPGAPTITKLRVISQHQQLIRLDHEETFDGLSPDVIEEKAAQLLHNLSAIVLSDYGKGTLQGCQQLIRLARSHNIPVLVDPKGSSFERYRGATVITPNLKEFETIVGSCRSEEELVSKGQQLLKDLELGALLITRSEHGMTLIREKEPEVHFPARAREVFDVTGAGDTVISVLAASLAAGCDLPQAAGLANIAAGIVVAKLGTASVSMPELRREVNRELGAERGAVSAEQLMVAVEDARAHGEKIVFTNGCFDILHAGHVGYLEQARKQGDRLILAINGDDSVTRLKGEGRPINPVDRRMAVLAGLEAVDWVVSFDEDTPENLIQAIKPDVLVKGGDYSLDEVVGAPIVHEYGGEVKVLAFLENCSTTAIVDKIRDEKEAQPA